MPATFSPRAASDAGACVRRFFLHRVDRSPDWAPDRTRSSVHEVVAQLVRVVELAGRDIPPDDRDAEAAEARLLDGARRALRGICDAQRELIGQGAVVGHAAALHACSVHWSAIAAAMPG